MSEVSITINGRSYDIGCDTGQESHIVELASYIDYKLQQIARAGAALNDTHLMVLTSLLIADELFQAKTAPKTPVAAEKPVNGKAAAAADGGLSKDDELALAKVLEHIVKRIDGIADRLQAA